MKKGVLIFAHNNRDVDYSLMALISGGLAKKYLNVPVSLVADKFTIGWMKDSGIFNKATDVFEHIIDVERPETDNRRKLFDGTDSKSVPFVNSNRSDAWNLTPYDRTLLIDSDFLIMSGNLSEYWDLDKSFLISNGVNDICDQDRMGYHDRYISDTGVKLYWATTIMFTKNQESKLFFNLVDTIKNNYEFFADLYRFDHRQYRNDIAFSVAKHILDGFETPDDTNLPLITTSLDKDILFSIEKEKMTFLVSPKFDGNFYAALIKGCDIHVMNKQSLVRNSKNLLEMI